MKMSRSLLLIFCLVIGLLILACSNAGTNRSATPATNASAPAASPAAATSNASATAVGVAECDAYITNYEKCVSTKVPEQARGPLRDSIARLRTDWKKLADDPKTRGTLAAACKSQLETTRTQMKAYGCAL
jgi:hypothetical protein